MPSLSRLFASASSSNSGSGHGSKRTQGPPTPDSTPGSALGTQLEREALHSSHHHDEKLLYHLIANETPGHVTIVCLLQERSLIEHQYLMVRVESDNGSHVSWIRAERMGYSADEQAMLTYDQRKQARVVLRVAPLWENLINSGDKIILRADLHGKSAKLVHVANLTWIVHNNKTQYNLLHRNCWWFARRILANLAAAFMEEGPKKQEVVSKCEEEESRHARAAYGLGHNKKLQRAVGFLEEIFDPSIIDYYKDIQEGGEDLGLWIFEESIECVKAAFDEYLKKK